jgi:WD40 repeat protein
MAATYLAVTCDDNLWLHDAKENYAAVQCIPDIWPNYFTFSPDNAVLAVAVDNLIRFWDVNVLVSEGQDAAEQLVREVSLDIDTLSMVFSHGGQNMLIHGYSPEKPVCAVAMLDCLSLQILWRKEYVCASKGSNFQLIFSGDDTRFLFRCPDDSFQWANVVDGSSGCPLVVHGGGFALSPSEEDVAFVDLRPRRNVLKVWSAGSLKCQIELNDRYKNNTLCPGLLCYCGSDSKVIEGVNSIVRMWDVSSQTLVWQQGEYEPGARLFLLVYCPDRNHVAVSSQAQPKVSVLEAANGTLVREFNASYESQLQYTNPSTQMILM